MCDTLETNIHCVVCKDLTIHRWDDKDDVWGCTTCGEEPLVEHVAYALSLERQVTKRMGTIIRTAAALTPEGQLVRPVIDYLIAERTRLQKELDRVRRALEDAQIEIYESQPYPVRVRLWNEGKAPEGAEEPEKYDEAGVSETPEKPVVHTPHTHALKCWPVFFQAVRARNKTCEWRRDDRGFKVGDTVLLQEWDPEKAAYTGEMERRVITHISRSGATGIPAGWCVLSLRLPAKEGCGVCELMRTRDRVLKERKHDKAS